MWPKLYINSKLVSLAPSVRSSYVLPPSLSIFSLPSPLSTRFQTHPFLLSLSSREALMYTIPFFTANPRSKRKLLEFSKSDMQDIMNIGRSRKIRNDGLMWRSEQRKFAKDDVERMYIYTAPPQSKHIAFTKTIPNSNSYIYCSIYLLYIYMRKYSHPVQLSQTIHYTYIIVQLKLYYIYVHATNDRLQLCKYRHKHSFSTFILLAQAYI